MFPDPDASEGDAEMSDGRRETQDDDDDDDLGDNEEVVVVAMVVVVMASSVVVEAAAAVDGLERAFPFFEASAVVRGDGASPSSSGKLESKFPSSAKTLGFRTPLKSFHS